MVASAMHSTYLTWMLTSIDPGRFVGSYNNLLNIFPTPHTRPCHPPPTGANTFSLVQCDCANLLDRLPRVQKLLRAMLMCLPEGAGANNELVITSASWVLRESRSIYRIVSEGIMNLADKFFEMERPDALRALEMYKEMVMLNEKLNNYFAQIQQHPQLKGNIQVPTLQASAIKHPVS